MIATRSPWNCIYRPTRPRGDGNGSSAVTLTRPRRHWPVTQPDLDQQSDDAETQFHLTAILLWWRTCRAYDCICGRMHGMAAPRQGSGLEFASGRRAVCGPGQSARVLWSHCASVGSSLKQKTTTTTQDDRQIWSQ